MVLISCRVKIVVADVIVARAFALNIYGIVLLYDHFILSCKVPIIGW